MAGHKLNALMCLHSFSAIVAIGLGLAQQPEVAWVGVNCVSKKLEIRRTPSAIWKKINPGHCKLTMAEGADSNPCETSRLKE